MRILLALGGEALLRHGEPASAANQRRNVEAAARAIADIVAEHEVVITHDSGPLVGHMLELALRNRLPERDVVSVLTEVVVAADDPAFLEPTKRISPEPYAIAEIRSLRVLLDAGALVICAGGSAPIALNGMGTMRRVEAVIDKDLTATLLARRLDADLLVMLTDVDAGSTGPKAEAARRFAEATGKRAAIGSLMDVERVVHGEAGTQIHSAATEPAISATRRLPSR